jgi:hypothetical protein
MSLGRGLDCNHFRPKSRSARCESRDHAQLIDIMLYTIAVILLVLWLLGMVTSTSMGGLIHILIVVAVVMVLINLLSGRKRL